MKIAIFTDSFFPSVGGTERAVLGLANEFVKSNEVVVFCPTNTKVEDNYNFKVVRVTSLQITKNDRMALPQLSRILKKEFVKFMPDIIHCHSVSGMASAALKFGKLYNIPVIFTVHTKFKIAFSNSIKSKLIVNFLIKDLAKKLNASDRVCSVSNDMINELKAYGCKKDIKIIKNGMVFEKQQLTNYIKNLAKEKYEISAKEKNLLFVGRIVKFKNIDLILSTLQNLNEKNIKFKMIFAGIGPDLEYYKKKIEALELDRKIFFTGSVTDDMLKSLYYNSDLFLFPSKFDNDPLVIVEAALFNTPSITLSGCGSSERIENNYNGFVANSEEEFIKKTQFVLSNDILLTECGGNAFNTIPRTWEESAREIFNEYTEIIAKKKEEIKLLKPTILKRINKIRIKAKKLAKLKP